MLGMGDLLTQVERRTPVVQVILNNEKYDFVHIEQQEAGIVPFGVEFKNPNFAKVAEAMGAKGIRIEEPEDVREGLAEALAYKDGPVVVDAVVDPFALAMPSHSPFHTVKGFTLSFAKQVLSGSVDTVIKDPQHPYTRLLMDSIPWPDLNRRWGETEIKARESELSDNGAGCKFYARCPFAMDKCKLPPPLFRLSEHQATSCYLHEQNPQIESERLSELLPV